MTSHSDPWLGGDGDWSDGAMWANGAPPTSSLVAKFNVNGTYTVDITTAITPADIVLEESRVTINETAAGSITTNTFQIAQGTAVLDGANTINQFVLDEATVEVGNAHALGVNAVHDQGTVIATASLALHNEFDVADVNVTFAAAAGHTLKLAGNLNDNYVPTELHFGTATDTGTVDIMGAANAGTNAFAFIFIDGGHVQTVAGHNAEATQIFNAASDTTIAAGATLDLGAVDARVLLRHLGGEGVLKNTGGGATIVLSQANFAGTLAGGMHIQAANANTLSGKLDAAVITMAQGTNTLDLSQARGSFILSAPDGSTSTVLIHNVGGEYTDFQNGNLTIDTTYAKHDTVTFEPGSGSSIILDIHSSGGAIVRQLTFDGITSGDGFVTGPDGHGHLKITWGGTSEHTPHIQDAQLNHAIDVANAIAAAVHTTPDVF